MIKKPILTLVLVLGIVLLLGLPVGAGSATEVSISPSGQTISPGQTFDVNVYVTLDAESRGAQFDLFFDQEILTCNRVTEGDLFNKGNTQSTQWKEPIIDNQGNGQIIGAACVIVNPSIPVSDSGVFATLSFTAKALGTSELELCNVIVGDAEGNSIEVIVTNGSITVELEGDVNGDGKVNVLDMVLVGIQWGGTGSADINKDGTVNILDSIIIGANWTG